MNLQFTQQQIESLLNTTCSLGMIIDDIFEESGCIFVIGHKDETSRKEESNDSDAS